MEIPVISEMPEVVRAWTREQENMSGGTTMGSRRCERMKVAGVALGVCLAGRTHADRAEPLFLDGRRDSEG